jgi:hypothetical protein
MPALWRDVGGNGQVGQWQQNCNVRRRTVIFGLHRPAARAERAIPWGMQHRRVHRFAPFLVALVGALGLASCADSDSDGSPASTSVAPATTGAGGVTTTSEGSASSTTQGSTERVSVFFGGEIDADCSPVLEFEREVDGGPVRGAFDALVAGPTAAEEAAGARSMFGPASAGSVRSVSFEDGLLVVDFDDFRDALSNASTSCGSEALLAQLDATAFQFPVVERVEYRLAGSCADFFGWLQRECATRERSDGDTSGADGEPFSTDTSDRTGDAVGDQSGQLVAVRMAGHDGFDRFVLELDGTGTPQYWVSYVERPVYDIPGNEVDVDGEFVLQVVAFPARRVDIEDPDFTPTYDGPLTVTSDTSNIVEAVFVGDFEATMEWVLGLRHETGFEVFTLTDPPRLVVDVSHD